MEMESGFQEWLQNRAKIGQSQCNTSRHMLPVPFCAIASWTIFRIRNKHWVKFLRALNALRKNNRSSLLLNKPD